MNCRVAWVGGAHEVFPFGAVIAGVVVVIIVIGFFHIVFEEEKGGHGEGDGACPGRESGDASSKLVWWGACRRWV